MKKMFTALILIAIALFAVTAIASPPAEAPTPMSVTLVAGGADMQIDLASLSYERLAIVNVDSQWLDANATDYLLAINRTAQTEATADKCSGTLSSSHSAIRSRIRDPRRPTTAVTQRTRAVRL